MQGRPPQPADFLCTSRQLAFFSAAVSFSPVAPRLRYIASQWCTNDLKHIFIPAGKTCGFNHSNSQEFIGRHASPQPINKPTPIKRAMETKRWVFNLRPTQPASLEPRRFVASPRGSRQAAETPAANEEAEGRSGATTAANGARADFWGRPTGGFPKAAAAAGRAAAAKAKARSNAGPPRPRTRPPPSSSAAGDPRPAGPGNPMARREDARGARALQGRPAGSGRRKAFAARKPSGGAARGARFPFGRKFAGIRQPAPKGTRAPRAAPPEGLRPGPRAAAARGAPTLPRRGLPRQFRGRGPRP